MTDPDRMYIGIGDCESLPITAAGVQIGDLIASTLDWRIGGKVISVGTIFHNPLIVWIVETHRGKQELIFEGNARVPGLPGIEF